MKKLIGNTPMIKINYKFMNKKNSVYVKLEYYNPTGSIKDRIAFYILEQAKKRNELKDGMSIIVATNGNTGISFAALGAYYKHPVTIFIPNYVSKEHIKLLELYGANVVLISKEDGGYEECIKRAASLAFITNSYHPNQFDNEDNVNAHYQTTAVEILKQTPVVIDAFVSGISTDGTLMGIGKRLKEENLDTKIIALKPIGASILKDGIIKKEHAIEEIGDRVIPKIANQNLIDDIYLIADEDAINMSRLLARKLGLGVGISSGANLLGAIKFQSQREDNVVTVFPDDNKKYLSTKLTEPLDLNSKFLSNQIELLDYEIID